MKYLNVLIFTIILLAASNVEAAIPAFCGDTVRGFATTACPAPDGDNDGWTTDGTKSGLDPDDTNMWIHGDYPYSTVGCSAGQVKKFVNGAFGACFNFATANCEATGTGRCYWVDVSSGNDATVPLSNSSTSPWLTLVNVSSHYGGSAPANWVDLGPGDVVYVAGILDETAAYTVGSTKRIFWMRHQQVGSATYPLTIKQWPGKARWGIIPNGADWDAGSSLNDANAFIVELGNAFSPFAQYIDIIGPELSNFHGRAEISGGDFTKLQNAYVHGLFLQQGSSAGAVFVGGRNIKVLNSVILDNYDPSSANGTSWNAQVRMFRGRANKVKYNVLGYTPAHSDGSTPNHGDCVNHKHGTTMALPIDPTEISNNVCFNATIGVAAGQPALRISRNRLIDVNTGIRFDDFGGATQIADESVVNNTVTGNRFLMWNPVDWYNETVNDSSTLFGADQCSGNLPMGSVTMRRNVFVSSSSDPWFELHASRSNYFWTNIWQAGKIISGDNCYYSSGSANGLFSILNINDSGSECAGYTRDQGADYTFAQYQAQGQEVGSFKEDAALTATHVATSANCLNKGALAPDNVRVQQNITEEICGDGIDNSESGYAKGVCPTGWTDALYSDGCDFLCPGIDKDQDGFYSENSGTRTETAQVNGTMTSVNTITVDSGHSIREGMFVDVASPARRVSSWTATTITVRGPAVSLADNTVINAVDAIDCDDTNRDIIPGESYYCDPAGGSVDGYRVCQASGSYGTCTDGAVTPFKPDTPGADANCKYVNAGSGSDSNNGSYATPYQTLGMLSGGSTGSEPGGAVTMDAAGTNCVVLVGNTDFTTAFTKGSDTILLDVPSTADGTALNPFVIERRPGDTARIINTNGHAIGLNGVTFTDVRNVEISVDTGGSGDAIGVNVGASNDHTFIRYRVYDSELNGDNNNAGIYCTGTNRCRVHNSFFWDLKKGEGAIDSIVGVLWMDDDGTGNGSGHSLSNSVLGADILDAVNGTLCFKGKHGPVDADVGADGHQIDRNFFVNCRKVGMWNGSGLLVRDNVVFSTLSGDGGSMGGIAFIDGGEPGSLLENNEVSYNTMISMGDINFTPTYDSNTEQLDLHHNVIVDNRTSWNDNGGIYRIHVYGNGTNRTQFETYNFLTSNNNCFDNPTASAANFAYFAGGGGSPTYNFTNWKALSEGYDAASFEKSPNFDAYHRAQDVDCANFGRRFIGVIPPVIPDPIISVTRIQATNRRSSMKGRSR